MTWQRVTWTAVGGVVAVGLPDETRVVVGSHSGVAVFDSTSGERTVRVRDNDYEWFDEEHHEIVLRLEGETERVPSAGIWGGLLPAVTEDGWEARTTSSGALLVRGDETVEVEDDEELRAFGFSPSGSVFVLATSPSIAIWRRVLAPSDL